ncbi:hypothetical protein [Ralstonia phage RP13]|nr:hypothetical protein [Ralstonia phage RP13]
MKTYIADGITKSSRYVQVYENQFGVLPYGVRLANVVDGYLMVVDEESSTYDSYIRKYGQWELYSVGKQFRLQDLAVEVGAGYLMETTLAEDIIKPTLSAPQTL